MKNSEKFKDIIIENRIEPQLLKRSLITTEDGSSSIHLPEWNESYHSKHGAIQESYHVFIKNGLDFISKDTLSILEMGLGTGLNAFITFLESKKNKKNIEYIGIEAYPVTPNEIKNLNYSNQLNATSNQAIFEKMHLMEWEKPFPLSSDFSLTKKKQLFENISYNPQFDLIYFDVFGYRVQPELWSPSIFQKMYNALLPQGILVTYAARSIIKKNMEEAGFRVEKLPGAPGKREMFRAHKDM